MYNCLRCAFDSFKSFADDMLSGLSQNLNSYILWNQILLDQGTQKFIFCFLFGLSGRGMMPDLMGDKI